MELDRRKLLRSLGATAGAAALAGCSSTSDDATSTDDESTDEPTDGESTESDGDEDEESSAAADVSAKVAVAAEWSAMRSRLDDARALVAAGDFDAAASVSADVFANFEGANGEYGAHEMLEATSKADYEGFESALGAFKTKAEEGDPDGAKAAHETAVNHLYEAQEELVGGKTTHAMDLQRLGARVANARYLAAMDKYAAAATVAADTKAAFEGSGAYEDVETAAPEAYEAFEAAIEATQDATGSADAEAVATNASDALAAAIEGSYAMAGHDENAGAGQLATMQARGFDAATLAGMGGPSTAFAHAAALNVYRHAAFDAHWLAARGETDAAATLAGDIYADFEGARAHEALEGADAEAYEGFEGGLESLKTAIEDGDSDGVDDAVATVESNLRAGIGALAGGTGAAVLQASFFRTRLEDALALYASGQNNTAAGVVESVFGRFEADELGFHEAFESWNAETYESFEGHLESLQGAMSSTDDSGVETHATGAMDALFAFETGAGSTAQVSAAASGYMAARAFDASNLAALGKRSRAASAVQEAFEFFEGGAGGFHEALEAADADLYESFESTLGGVTSAAENDSDVYAAAVAYHAKAVEGVYAVVANAGGSFGGAANAIASDAFAAFENAEVHELLEDGDADAYETFEAKLNALVEATSDGSGVDSAASAYATATTRAQFAVVDAVEDAPVDASGGGESEEEVELEGGPNVVSGVPEDADHVVDMKAVAFDPAELTVSKGDKVAFEHVGGEPHSVTAKADGVPSDAEYWASGGFASQEKAETGWENGKGAVASGQSYVHTFETTGTHEYYCIPHAAAGMEAKIVVEE
jgi:plastocyanin